MQDFLPQELWSLVQRANQCGALLAELAVVRGRDRPDREPDPHESGIRVMQRDEE